MFLVQKSTLSSHFRSTKKTPPNVPKPHQPTTKLFNQKIHLHLKNLDLDLGPNPSSLTFSWLSAAVSLISSLHSDPEAQILNLKPEYEYYGLYMEYSLKVLDLCNLVSWGVNGLTHKRLLMNYSLRVLKSSDGLTSVAKLEKLKKVKDGLGRLVNDTDGIAKEKGFSAKKLVEELCVLVGKFPRGDRLVGGMTVFVGSVLVSVLYGETTDVVRGVSKEFELGELVSGVWDKVFDLMKVKGNVIMEVDDVRKQAVVVCDLVDGVIKGGDDGDGKVRLEEGVKEMEIRVKRFSDGVDALTNGVNGMFRTVLKLRNGCLDL